ncbi:MAG: hypothetical protein FWF47_05070 [Clostridia bacterium]|nr:hypothetical protein [Clostridia bacterium]
MNEMIEALQTIRAPVHTGEYHLHDMVRHALAEHGLHPAHEVKLGPRMRIDFKCGSVGIEVKKGRPQPGRLLGQIRRYLACEQLDALIIVSERCTQVPKQVNGKPVRIVSLYKLWGISL